METNKLYFIKEEYFEKYKCSTSSVNKAADKEGEHNRPCYYAFKEGDIYWMIPISSQVTKYEYEYKKSTKGLTAGIMSVVVGGIGFIFASISLFLLIVIFCKYTPPILDR